MKRKSKRIAAAALLSAIAGAALVSAATAGSTYALRGASITVDEEKGISRTTGSLLGTWQTTSFETIAEGVAQDARTGEVGYQYAAAGTETFSGCHDRNANKRCEASEKGTLRFTFAYWGTYDPATGALVRGQCQHPIVGGTGAFKGARGVVYMKDTPTASGVVTVYSGALAYGGASARTLASARSKGCGRA
jgi:hypothetical protein